MDENAEAETPWRFVKTRLSQDEYQGFMLVLAKLETNGARFLRKVIREAIGQGPDLLINDLQAFRETTFQVGAIGRNLNQLVRAFHSGQLNGGQVDIALLESVRDQIVKLEKELLEVVMRSRQRWVNYGG
jgi:hypothetical protein